MDKSSLRIKARTTLDQFVQNTCTVQSKFKGEIMAILQILLFISNISCCSISAEEHYCAETKAGRLSMTKMQVLGKR